jgi:hypothetical protein
MPRVDRRPPPSRLRRFLVGCSVGCGSGLLLLLLAAGIIYYRMTGTPPQVIAPLPPAPRTAGGGAAQAPPPPPPIDTQVEEIKRVAESHQAAPVSLRATEAQVNNFIARKLDPSTPIRDVRVTLRQGDAFVTGRGTWSGREYWFTATAAPYVTNGRVALRLTSGSIGQMPLPSPVLGRFQAEIDRALGSGEQIAEGVQVTGVNIANGELTLSGQTVPR